MPVNYNTNVISNPLYAEAGKFVDLSGNTRFPSISVIRTHYPDDTQAFPENAGVPPITSVDIYPKYGVISYIANTDEFAVSLSAGQVFLDITPAVQQLTAINVNTYNTNNAAVATEWNTFDTLTAVVAFNNNFMCSVTALSVTVTNPITAANIKQTVTNWDVLSANLNNSTYTTLPSNPANEITILNNTGGTMYIKNASKSIGLPIDNNTSVDLKLVGDTSEVAIKASSANKTVFATFISYN
jgi:hypothetical protein